MPSEQAPKTIYYNLVDHASLFRRLTAISIDIIFLTLLLFILVCITAAIQLGSKIITIIFFAIAILYLTSIKSSSMRTIGYRITRIKIVTVNGDKPGFFKMLFRVSLLLVGPFQFPFDILWALDDANRQTLRDKMTGTYVVNISANKIGNCRYKSTVYFIMGYCLIFSEAERQRIAR